MPALIYYFCKLSILLVNFHVGWEWYLGLYTQNIIVNRIYKIVDVLDYSINEPTDKE